MKRYIIWIALCVVVLFTIYFKHQYFYSFNYKTGEISIQDKKTAEYWGLYWQDKRPYPYHDGQYYIQYEINFDTNIHDTRMTWHFNKQALHK